MLPTLSTQHSGRKKEVVDVLEFYLKRTNTGALLTSNMRVTKNAWLAGGMVAAVALAFYPIYFRPKLWPEEYSEPKKNNFLTMHYLCFTFAEEAQKRNRAVIPKDKLRQSGECHY